MLLSFLCITQDSFLFMSCLLLFIEVVENVVLCRLNKKCIIFSFTFILHLTLFLRAVEICSSLEIEGRHLERIFLILYLPSLDTCLL